MLLNEFGELSLSDGDYEHIKRKVKQEHKEVAEVFGEYLETVGVNRKEVYSITATGGQLRKYNDIYAHIVCDFEFRNK